MLLASFVAYCTVLNCSTAFVRLFASLPFRLPNFPAYCTALNCYTAFVRLFATLPFRLPNFQSLVCVLSLSASTGILLPSPSLCLSLVCVLSLSTSIGVLLSSPSLSLSLVCVLSLSASHHYLAPPPHLQPHMFLWLTFVNLDSTGHFDIGLLDSNGPFGLPLMRLWFS